MPTPTPSAIQIVALEPQRDKGALRAFVSVRLGPSLIVHKCRVIQKDGQRAWVSMPQESWVDDLGVRQYRPLVELSGDLKERVRRAILAEARAQGAMAPVPSIFRPICTEVLCCRVLHLKRR